jgi:hypothetical protein
MNIDNILVVWEGMSSSPFQRKLRGAVRLFRRAKWTFQVEKSILPLKKGLTGSSPIPLKWRGSFFVWEGHCHN